MVAVALIAPTGTREWYGRVSWRLWQKDHRPATRGVLQTRRQEIRRRYRVAFRPKMPKRSSTNAQKACVTSSSTSVREKRGVRRAFRTARHDRNGAAFAGSLRRLFLRGDLISRAASSGRMAAKERISTANHWPGARSTRRSSVHRRFTYDANTKLLPEVTRPAREPARPIEKSSLQTPRASRRQEISSIPKPAN